MKIGYIRVSTADQNTARQETLMKQLGAEKLFIDRDGGAGTPRKALQDMLAFVREGDTLVVESYSRLARSTKDLLDIIEKLQKKNVTFVSQKEAIDTATPAGRLMLTIFAGLCQFERETLRERQREGIAEAKKAGKYKGRRPIQYDTETFKVLYPRWKAGEITAMAMARTLGLNKATFYRRVREFEGR